MKAHTLFVHTSDLKAGEVRALRVLGLEDGDAVVYLDRHDSVTRVRRGSTELDHTPWDIQQVLADTLDPHAVGVAE